MLDKILRITGSGALYFCTGLLVAAVLLGLYLMFAWKIDKGKLNRMFAIARGRDIMAEEAKLRREIEDRISQLTYDQVLAERAAKGPSKRRAPRKKAVKKAVAKKTTKKTVKKTTKKAAKTTDGSAPF